MQMSLLYKRGVLRDIGFRDFDANVYASRRVVLRNIG